MVRRPWYFPAQWRDHFMAPTQPYTVKVHGRDILDVSNSSVPLLPTSLPVRKIMRQMPPPLLHKWHQIGVITPNPVYHNLAYMKAAARVMLARGARVLSLTWHSSEVMAGATPHLPTQAHVDNVLQRTHDFLQWLGGQVPVRGMTIGQLDTEKDLPIHSLSEEELSMPGDWHP